MEAQPLPRETLDTYLLHDRSLQEWHDWLVTDQDTGTYTGNDLVPCSRYGRNGEACAFWAIACEVIYCEANGSDDDPEVALDYLQGLAVNDSDSVAELVYEYWHALPRALKRQLGTKKDVKRLLT